MVDPRYRCLIVLTHFANPAGVPRAKTRSWFSVKEEPILAWAGFCRNTPEFGRIYGGRTMEANEAIPPTNDRMPVLLEGHEYDRWLHGDIRDVIWFQQRRPFAAERMQVDHTDDLWGSGAAPPATERQFALLWTLERGRYPDIAGLPQRLLPIAGREVRSASCDARAA